MNIQGTELITFIKSNEQYKVPFYQREYTWGKDEIKEYLEDICTNESDSYYLGTIVIKKDGFKTTIVDGQQRLSTTFLFLKAIRHYCEDGTDAAYEVDQCLEKKFDSENLKDGNILKKILEEKTLTEKEKESNYYKNINVMHKYISNEITNIEEVVLNIRKVKVAAIAANEDIDEHALFSKINSTGKTLKAYDLVKNFLFSNFESYIIDDNLEKIERATKDFTVTQKDDMIRHFIAFKDGELVKKDSKIIYTEFKKVVEKNDNNYELIFNELFNFSIYYRFLLVEMKNKTNVEFYDEISILLKSFNTYSILLIEILRAHSSIEDYEIVYNDDQLEEIKKSLVVVEAYKIRREFVNLKEKEITRAIPIFAQKIRLLKDVPYDKKLIKILLNDANEKNMGYRMPTVEEFKQGFIDTHIYNTPKFVKDFLIRLENYQKKEKLNYESDFSIFSIEHIMPQKIVEWEEDLEYDEELFNKTLHTIGNLTITADNTKLSNSKFEIKKEILKEKSRINLNNQLQEYEIWDYETIISRSNIMFNDCQKIWNLENKYSQEELNFEFGNDEKNKEVIKKEEEVEREDLYETLKKNKSYIKLIPEIKYGDIVNLLYNFLVLGQSTTENEKSIFKIEKNGWISKSLYDALGYNDSTSFKGRSSDEKFNSVIKSKEESINHLIDYIENKL